MINKFVFVKQQKKLLEKEVILREMYHIIPILIRQMEQTVSS
jgi:hypothetical protein